jgi:hypothetical protein
MSGNSGNAGSYCWHCAGHHSSLRTGGQFMRYELSDYEWDVMEPTSRVRAIFGRLLTCIQLLSSFAASRSNSSKSNLKRSSRYVIVCLSGFGAPSTRSSASSGDKALALVGVGDGSAVMPNRMEPSTPRRLLTWTGANFVLWLLLFGIGFGLFAAERLTHYMLNGLPSFLHLDLRVVACRS